ncbi:six-cysteine ranthipeptide SCIFF [Microaerobacter geothermalis]|uniref:six-cysteine ranthipeptide SCIFF n=1 Tax=Microaerobacter geothermalis TaxID=674972 RepID=UPI001F242B1F|nr:six-cysteine ranthipeptide SCIFF [Microaerobacter geothermalis]MCF6092835.1 six-cysteine ranthipeptide SCIFF [Microaerobacter geothermalis]
MKHIKVIRLNRLQETQIWGDCAYCTASCQSACKSSLTVASSMCYKKVNEKKEA